MDRRKALLSSAAVVALLGTLLVFFYVRGADARADARYEAVQVLRVAKPIAAGESVAAAQAAGKFVTGTISSQDRLPGALAGLEPLEDQVALTPMYAGEQVVEDKFGAVGSEAELPIPAGKLAISMNLDDPSRVAGFLDPGDKVAVLMSGSDEDGPWTRLLLRNVQVIGTGSTSATVSAQSAGDPEAAAAPDELPQALLTLAVSQREAEQLTFANNNGTLSLALLNDKSAVAKGGPVTQQNLFD
ncbi:Flp pilus assembly protein CpaB [Nocardioides marmoraquaticus]